MKDFFISHNRADGDWAGWIAWQLEEAGYTTTLQAWDFRPGANFVVHMDRAIKEADRTIAVLSPDYLAARYPMAEWAAAVGQDPTGEAGKLLPVRVQECSPEGLMTAIVFIDLVGLTEPAAKGALLAGVRRGRAKPAAAPHFPGGAVRTVARRPPFPGLAELFPGADQRRLEELEADPALSREDKLWLAGMGELAELNKARGNVMSRIIALDEEAAALAVQRDRIYRILGEPGQKQEYERLKARSEEIGRKREALSGELKELGSKSERLLNRQKASTKAAWDELRRLHPDMFTPKKGS